MPWLEIRSTRDAQSIENNASISRDTCRVLYRGALPLGAHDTAAPPARARHGNLVDSVPPEDDLAIEGLVALMRVRSQGRDMAVPVRERAFRVLLMASTAITLAGAAWAQT